MKKCDTYYCNLYDIVVSNIKKVRAKYPILNIGINATLIKDINSDKEEIENLIKFATSIKSSLKFVEIYPSTLDKFIPVASLIPFLENKNFVFKKILLEKRFIVMEL